VTIVERRSFGRAAAALGMPQPALSRRIAALEQELGVALFSRAHRQIELTAAGEIFAREAIAVFAQAAVAQSALRDAALGNKAHLNVGTRSSSRYVVIPAAVRCLRSAYPEVSVRLSDAVAGLELERVRKGVLDLTVVRGPVKLEGLRSERLRTDPLAVALPEGHRLATAPVIDVAQLSEEPFVEIALYRAYAYKDLVRGVSANAGFIPNVVQEVDAGDTLAMSVAAGIGIALMPDLSRELPISGIVYRPLRPKQPAIPLQAVWRAGDENPAIVPFVRCLKEAAKA